MSKIAVIGAGISGLASAWLLARQHEVVLYEANRYPGGHTNTVDATVDGITHAVDTGFLVFNDRTYPNLVKLFAHLGVEAADSDMSFSVRIGDGALEWSGTSLATVFAQPSNLAKPRFLRMLADLIRFNREASRLAESGAPVTGTLGEFLDARGYGREVRELYLIPMAACIWSTPATQINRFPMQTFLHFCANHGLLAVSNRPQWRTVKGGAREYVRKLLAGIPDLRLATPVHQVRRFADRVELATDHGTERFDQVVLATHTDQSLAMLEHASVEERAVLKAIPYLANRAVLHTDERLLPRRRRAWASWNFHAPRPELSDEPVSLTYLINRLQPLPWAQPVLVSLNPDPARPIAPAQVIGSYDYSHPVFDLAAIRAQQQLPALQGRSHLWFCGAWTRYGFHEDGLSSALDVVQRLRDQWRAQDALPAAA